MNVVAQSSYTLHPFVKQQLSDVYYSEGVAVGDINGDGQNDVVYGPYWFAGPDFKTKHEIFAPVPQPMEKYSDHFFAWTYDFNGDKANDIFVVGFPGTPAHVYENPGKGEGAWKKHQVFDWVSNESPQLTNLVGDEKPELICTRDGLFGFATIDWTKPFSAWKFYPISEKVATERFGHGLGVGDVNGDGLQDVIHADGWFQQPKTGAMDGRWESHKVKFTSAYGGADMFAYDVDGDGLNDIITSEAAHDFGLSWYKQKKVDGQSHFERQPIMGNHPSDNKYGLVFSELHSVNLADMDGDGLKDIVTGKTYYSHHKQSPMWDAGAVVYWFKLVRGKEGVDFVPYVIDGTTGIGRQLVIADINKDGKPDVATGGMLGSSVLIHQTKAVSQEEFQAAQPKPYTGPKPKQVSDAKRLRGGRNPIGPDGLVAGAIEAEKLKATVTAGTAQPQAMKGFPMDRWSGDSQLWWTAAKPGDKLTLELDVLNEIESLQMALTCAQDYGVFEISLDGKALSAPVDLYETQVVTTGLIEFDTGKVARGKHSLTFEIVGCNPKAVKQYMLGIDYLRFKLTGQKIEDATSGIRPVGLDGRVLNLDFETGTLVDWKAEGAAFEGQPIKGDTVAARRNDSTSRHQGTYWIGTFEKSGDKPKGTLTSEKFKASARFASFLVGGGSAELARIELWIEGDDKPFFTAAGKQSESMSQVVADMRRAEGKNMFIRLVDDSSGGWGHINFDHFRLHEQRPGPLTDSIQPLVADEYPHAGLSAAEAAKAMKVPQGFGVIACASEPDVKQPIAMAIDDRGRTWIAEAYEYPIRAKGEKGRDRILIFEDTDGDSKFDKSTVFAEGLNLVSGLEVGFGGVWVGAAPYLMFIPDANGDDKADSEPKILLDGWGYQDTHETLNTFSWGPDGWLYGCHGVFTHSKVGKPGADDKSRIPINAGIWRYHPTQHVFEVYAHGTSNPWGFDFNEMGDSFSTACVIPHLFHIIPQARYMRQAGQHFNPHTYADIPTIADHLHYLGATPHSGNSKSDAAGGGHAHAGAMIYQGGKWPKEYNGAIFMNNIHGQRLNVDLLSPSGSGYVGKHSPDFLLTGDQASQILNLQYGPDGDVIFIDWYDMQACHRNEVEVHDRSNGRIYKVYYGKLESTKVDLTKSSDAELAKLTTSSNEWYVRHARRILQERASKGSVSNEAIATLRSIATTHADVAGRLRALWALYCIGSLDDASTQAGIQDVSPHVRAWALRLLLQGQGFKPNAASQAQLVDLSKDKSPIVRLAVASITNRIPAESRWDILAGLVTRPEDAKDHNLPLLYWYAMEPLADVDADRALALGMASGDVIPLLRDFMLKRVAGAGGSAAISRLVAGLEKVDAPELQKNFLTAIRAALAGQRKAEKPSSWEAVYARLSKSSNADVALQATALGVVFGDASAMKLMREQLSDSKADLKKRLASLDSLLAAGDAGLTSTLISLVKQSAAGSEELTEAAIRGLAQYDEAATGPMLVAQYEKFSASQRRAAIATLCSRAASAKAMLEAIASKKINSADLTADLARQLEYLGDEQLNKRLGEVWGQVRKSSKEKAELIKRYMSLLERNDLPAPDVALGRALFAKTCQRCHTLYGIGQQLGPDITGSNRANLDYLMENIVDPSAVMAKEYRQTAVLTESGQIVTGILRGETEKAVTIQTAESTVVIPKDEIESRRESELSMMPEDQLNQFTEHQVRSLIAYLRGKSQSPLLATAENAAQFFNGKSLEGWNGDKELWSVQDGEIVGLSKGLKRNEFLVSDMLARDFKISMDVKLVKNEGNSGVQFRSQAKDGGDVSGYQADIGAGWWGKLYEEHGRELLWKESGEAHLKSGEWNRYEIEAVGSRVRTWLNGKLCVDLDDPDGAREGIFALQLHSGGPTEIRFKNLQLEVK
ncbi:MAG: PVC-type heme-binding CxxCH protein [Pirellulales bacterium]